MPERLRILVAAAFHHSLTAFFLFLPAMLFIYDSDLPFPYPFSQINVVFLLIHQSTISTLSFISMRGNNGGTRQALSRSNISPTQALETARDSPEGAQDPEVVTVLEAALSDIWRNIQAQPTSYIMTRDEFAVFNYFQSRFEGESLAASARSRYWDYHRDLNGRSS